MAKIKLAESYPLEHLKDANDVKETVQRWRRFYENITKRGIVSKFKILI
jgi:heme oxygenase